MSIYSGKVASKKITGKLGEESEKLSGLLKKTRKPVSIATRTKRLVKKFMPKKRYRKFKVVDVEELARKQCLKPNIQLFAEEEKFIYDCLTPAQRSSLLTLENTVRDHLKETDFSGTLRDLNGNPVPKINGGYYDHIGEMKNSFTSLNKIKKSLENSLKNPNLDVRARKLLSDGLAKATFYVDKINKLFEPYGGIQ